MKSATSTEGNKEPLEIKQTWNSNRLVEYSALKVLAPDPVALVDGSGRVFVYTVEGEKLDTGVSVPMPLPEGQQAVFEVLRALGLRCVRS